jgi:hypothetical protein
MHWALRVALPLLAMRARPSSTSCLCRWAADLGKHTWTMIVWLPGCFFRACLLAWCLQ